jgi:hypothetical protein
LARQFDVNSMFAQFSGAPIHGVSSEPDNCAVRLSYVLFVLHNSPKSCQPRFPGRSYNSLTPELRRLSKDWPRLENLWVPPVSWRQREARRLIGKPQCVNVLRVSRNMLKPAFWSPAEPAWDFEVTPCPFQKAILGSAGDWCPLGDHLKSDQRTRAGHDCLAAPAPVPASSVQSPFGASLLSPDQRKGADCFLFFLT